MTDSSEGLSRRSILEVTGSLSVGGLGALAGCTSSSEPSSSTSTTRPGATTTRPGTSSTSSTSTSTGEELSFSRRAYKSIDALKPKSEGGFGPGFGSLDLAAIRSNSEIFDSLGVTWSPPAGVLDIPAEDIDVFASDLGYKTVSILRFNQSGFRDTLEANCEKRDEYEGWEIWAATEREDYYAVNGHTVVWCWYPQSISSSERVRGLVDGFTRKSGALYEDNAVYAAVVDAVDSSVYTAVTTELNRDWFPNARYRGLSLDNPKSGRITVVEAYGFPPSKKPAKSTVRETLVEHSGIPYETPDARESGTAVVLSERLNVDAFP